MLVLTRKPGEKIIIGNQYRIEIAAVQRGVVKFLFSVNQPLTLMPGNIDLNVGSDEGPTQLAVTRRVDDSVLIGADAESQVEILVVSIKGEAVRVGVRAPREVTVYREEVWRMIEAENASAAKPQDLDKKQVKGSLEGQPDDGRQPSEEDGQESAPQ